MARQVAEAATKAGDAGRAAAAAADAANSAGTHALAASQAAGEAADHAARSGADASRARAAAASAAANARRANRAAAAAARFANTAADAAYTARNAANRAAADAEAAAAAADDAAAHAGQAADAALRATEHANAATRAAEAAVNATAQAQALYDAARAAEAEQLAVAVEEGREAARALGTEVERHQAAARWDAAEAATRSAETNGLIAQANNPATPRDAAVTAARRVALALSGSDGTWTREAAEQALAGDDTTVLAFVRTGIPVAAGMDDRVKLGGLMAEGSEAMRTAAEAALAGSDADVARFLATGDYPGRETEDRIAVNQVLSAAREAGDTTVAREAQEALDTGTPQALRDFLGLGRYTAAAIDERVKVNQILANPNSGPELKGAAQIALDGPPSSLRQFLQAGRYAAAQRDEDSARHSAVAQALLAQAYQAAATATANAFEAQAWAARARNAAAEAAGYAQQAANSANRAAGFAQQARQSADQAAASAARAAAAARTARNAAAAANVSARKAANSAVWASTSARNAYGYAKEAYASAKRAYDSAVAAGRDANEAAAAYADAVNIVKEKVKGEQARWAYQQARRCEGPLVDRQECLDSIVDTVRDPIQMLIVRGNACAIIWPQGSDFYKGCIFGALSPNFALEQGLTLASVILQSWAELYAALAVIEIVVVVALVVVVLCNAVCAAILEVAGPFLAPELIGVPIAGYGLLAGTAAGVRAATLLERAAVEARAEQAALSRLVRNLDACANSFTRGTRVLVADGTSKPIEGVRAGDRVLSTDPVADATRPGPVSHTVNRASAKRLVDVTVDTDGPAGAKAGTLTATDNHLFWVADAKAWVPAGSLQAGQWLRTSGGTWVQVAATSTRTAYTTGYNFTVTGHHTYYAFAGDTPVLVHNSDPCKVALGMREYDTAKFATTHGATHYLNLPDDLWKGPVQAAILNTDVVLYINLKGFDGATSAEQFMLAALAGTRAGAKATQQEMRWLAEAVFTGKRQWNTVKFYDAQGNVVTFPEPNWKSWNWPQWYRENHPQLHE
jgi:hypothetical protein